MTETFSNLYGVKKRRNPAATGSGGVRFRSRWRGVYYDYTTDGGFVVVDREFLKKHWRDDRLSALAIYLTEDARPEQVRKSLEKVLDPTMVLISNRGLKKTRIEHIRSDVRHHVCAGVHRRRGSSSRRGDGLSSNILERVHEIGALRAMGFNRKGIVSAIMGEAVIIGVLSVLVGLASGVCLAAI